MLFSLFRRKNVFYQFVRFCALQMIVLIIIIIHKYGFILNFYCIPNDDITQMIFIESLPYVVYFLVKDLS